MSPQADDLRNVYKQRLLNVAKALRESPAPDQFRMDDVINDCGTPACAFGHYACRADLQSAYCPQVIHFDRGDVWHVVLSGTSTHVSYTGQHVREHFGLDRSEVTELFEGDGCGMANTANEAANYIEQFVARKYGSAA